MAAIDCIDCFHGILCLPGIDDIVAGGTDFDDASDMT
jgi:hypothetical protein